MLFQCVAVICRESFATHSYDLLSSGGKIILVELLVLVGSTTTVVLHCVINT
jgi:hypothetical protein